MENILKELQLFDKIHVFKQRNINVQTFEFIMGPNCIPESREMLRNELGLSKEHLDYICAKIALQNKMKSCVSPILNNLFPSSKPLTSSYGRNNRISKMMENTQQKSKSPLNQQHITSLFQSVQNSTVNVNTNIYR